MSNRVFCYPSTLNPFPTTRRSPALGAIAQESWRLIPQSLSDPTHLCVDITVGRRESEVGKVPDRTQRLRDDPEEIRKMASFDRSPVGNRVYELMKESPSEDDAKIVSD